MVARRLPYIRIANTYRADLLIPESLDQLIHIMSISHRNNARVSEKWLVISFQYVRKKGFGHKILNQNQILISLCDARQFASGRYIRGTRNNINPYLMSNYQGPRGYRKCFK